jgi:3',5'-cyclic AMP phosphodiesterase CpdA
MTEAEWLAADGPMKRLAWVTDVHLNFPGRGAVDGFFRSLAVTDADAVLLSGDVGEAPDVARYLNELDTWVGRPVYFVLGNHDFYRGTIAGVRSKVADLCSAVPTLHWLPLAGVVPLNGATCLVGHDGWGDGRHGDYWGSRVMLNDWQFIGEFLGLDAAERLRVLHALGDEAAAHFRSVLPEALTRYRHVLVVTHVPPFRESCWHRGKISGDEWLPHFACKAVGDVLQEAMAAYPDREMTVLCGHTHGAGEVQVLPNLRVLTGGAEYGHPAVQRVLEVA